MQKGDINMIPFKVDLGNEVIAITGAGGVLMSAFAKALAECGASVGIIDRNAEACAKVTEEINAAGGKAAAVSCVPGQRSSQQRCWLFCWELVW